ncbi:unnamed protein product [Heligmosomoides polygyrus]|uniref:Transcriptional regulator n=1 Tax=Heligmosomoides polygyrus TaxID=6339 RepID=A0A183FAA8_HELPZ|nr:unnamed protein product [Heligmosomoides polygyrus]
MSGRHYLALRAFPDTSLLFNYIVGISAHSSSLCAPVRLSRKELAILQLRTLKSAFIRMLMACQPTNPTSIAQSNNWSRTIVYRHI